MRYSMRYRMTYRMGYPNDAISNGFSLRYRVRYSHLCLLCVLAQSAAAATGMCSSCLVVCIAELRVDDLDASLRGLAALGTGIMRGCCPVAGENGMGRPACLVCRLGFGLTQQYGYRLRYRTWLGSSPGVCSSSSSD